MISIVSGPDITSYWGEVLKGLEPNDLDMPLAVIYSLDRASDQDWPKSKVSFEGGLGVAEDHSLAIKSMELDHPTNPLVRLMNKSVTSKVPMVLHQSDGSIPEGLLNGVCWRGFGEPSTVLVVLALFAAGEITGFLLVGLNPRRAYDDDYDGFIQLLSKQLAQSLTSAVLMEQAKQKQARLSKDVADSESRFKALTELNSAGYFFIFFRSCVSTDTEILQAVLHNSKWVGYVRK